MGGAGRAGGGAPVGRAGGKKKRSKLEALLKDMDVDV